MSNDRRPPDEGAPPRGADTGRAADGLSLIHI